MDLRYKLECVHGRIIYGRDFEGCPACEVIYTRAEIDAAIADAIAGNPMSVDEIRERYAHLLDPNVDTRTTPRYDSDDPWGDGLKEWLAEDIERVLLVKKLRTGGHTWRMVAEDCSEAWGLPYGSNQIWGMDLCRAAAELLGRTDGFDSDEAE